MTVNMVTVTVAAQASPADAVAPEGNFIFSPNGTEWPGTPGSLPVVPSVQSGHLVDGTGSVQLVASDNFDPGVLFWDVIINIRGMPTVNFAGTTVNFATGALQSVWDVLSASGWVPIAQP